MVKKRWFTSLFFLFCTILLSLVTLFTACSTPSAPPPATKSPTASAVIPTPTSVSKTTQHEEVKLEMWSGPNGGNPYIAFFAISDVLNKTHPWIRASIMETQGAWDNYLHAGEKKENRNKTLLSVSNDVYASSFLTGTEEMKGRQPPKKGDMLLIGSCNASCNLFVTYDPNIKKGIDLKGKRLSGFTKGSGAYNQMLKIFPCFGIKLEDLAKYDGLTPEAATAALSDGLADVNLRPEPFVPGKPDVMTGVLAQLLAAPKPLYNIWLPKEDYDKENAIKPITAFTWNQLPPGHYGKNWTGGGFAMGISVALWCFSELSQDIQYELAKTLIEKTDMLASYGGAGASLLPAQIVGNIGKTGITSEDEIAPGALKYYKESGLWAKYSPLAK